MTRARQAAHRDPVAVRVRRLAAWWLPAAILSPGLAWIALDRSVWPWDQAWFGAQTLTLYETLRGDPLAWPAALLRATPLKPPAVAWIGQLFVPLASVVGSVDVALLLSVWACHVVALIFVFRALLQLAGGRAPVAAAGTLVVGAAPIFIALSTQYLAEASQTLAVGWFVLLMSRAPDWSRARLAAHLVGATAFAMLAKTTSPLYCTGPGIVALYHVIRRRPGPSTPDASGPLGGWTRWAFALLLAAAGAAWYGRNLGTVLHHASIAAFGPVAEFYGHRDTFWGGLREWSRNAATIFFMKPLPALTAALVAVGATRRLVRGSVVPFRHVDACAAAATLQVVIALVAFALSPNRDPRYAAPLLPLVAVVVSWSILQVGSAWVAPAVFAALTLQWALVHSQVLGLWPARPAAAQAVIGIDPALCFVHDDRGAIADVQAIVGRTCGHGGFGAYNMVGVDLLHLSGHSLTYAAAKERLAGRAGACRYDSIAYSSVESARAELGARPYVYWITVDPDVRPIPPMHAFVNRSAPVVFRQLRRQGVLQPEAWNGPRGVLLFRFVKP